MDAGRQDEERERKHRQADEHGDPIGPPAHEPDDDRGGDHEQHGPDEHGGERPRSSTPTGHDVVLSGQLQMTQSPIRKSPGGDGEMVASQTQVRVSAMLWSWPSDAAWMTSAHGLNAFTDRYG